jgi:CDP-diacylglycerol--glycerol-3-phosphate 3-phosphatidyltransferase
MRKAIFFIVNGITGWRIAMAPLVVFLAFDQRLELFKWFLAVSFMTDAVDGFLARKFNVTSKRGAILDSIGDDLTVGAAIVGMFVFKMDFILQQRPLLLTLTVLYVTQLCLALIRYHKMTSFHTWLAKIAAILQGIFLLLLFFLPGPVHLIFYIMASVTLLDLVEEIILVIVLRRWQADVKGLYWVIRRRQLP